MAQVKDHFRALTRAFRSRLSSERDKLRQETDKDFQPREEDFTAAKAVETSDIEPKSRRLTTTRASTTTRLAHFSGAPLRAGAGCRRVCAAGRGEEGALLDGVDPLFRSIL